MGSPIVFTYTEENNTQHTFLDFVTTCCLDGDLCTGDFLVMDNAPVHNNSNVDVLSWVLEFFGVTPVFLPPYSPELNPCELVFSLVKNRVRNHRDGYSHIFLEVLRSLRHVTQKKMKNFYKHCLFPKNILPELAIN